MRPTTFAAWLLCLAVTVASLAARHDPRGLPPKVVNAIEAVELVVIEELQNEYLVVLRNASKEALVRVEWTTTRQGEQRSGAFDAPKGGIASGVLFEVPVARIATAHDEEEEIPDEELEAHRQVIDLKRAVFAGRK